MVLKQFVYLQQTGSYLESWNVSRALLQPELRVSLTLSLYNVLSPAVPYSQNQHCCNCHKKEVQLTKICCYNCTRSAKFISRHPFVINLFRLFLSKPYFLSLTVQLGINAYLARCKYYNKVHFPLQNTVTINVRHQLFLSSKSEWNENI